MISVAAAVGGVGQASLPKRPRYDGAINVISSNTFGFFFII